MGQTRSIIIGLALALGQTAGAAAADLGLPPPPEPEPCVGCVGPWYLKGFVGAANPDVGDIFAEEFKFNDFTVYHKDIKSTPLWGPGFGYDTNHYFRFDITGEYHGSAVFLAQDSFPGGLTFPGGTNELRLTSRAGSDSPTCMSISVPGIVSRPISAAVSASPRSRSLA